MPGYQYNPGGSSISGLTTNRLPKALSSSTLGNSLFSDDGTDISLVSGKLIVPAGSTPAIAASNNNNTGITPSLTNVMIILGGSITTTFSNVLLYSTLGLKLPGSTKTTTYNMSQQDAFLFADATTAGFTITLPAASGAANGTIGQFFVIQKIDATANVVTISRAGADTINGAASKTLTTQYAGILIFGTGDTSWGAITLVAA